MEGEKRMQLLKKKQLIKQIDLIKQTNHSTAQFLTALSQKYSFTDDEKQSISNIETHLYNMNLIFDNMQKQVDFKG